MCSESEQKSLPNKSIHKYGLCFFVCFQFAEVCFHASVSSNFDNKFLIITMFTHNFCLHV